MLFLMSTGLAASKIRTARDETSTGYL